MVYGVIACGALVDRHVPLCGRGGDHHVARGCPGIAKQIELGADTGRAVGVLGGVFLVPDRLQKLDLVPFGLHFVGDDLRQ